MSGYREMHKLRLTKRDGRALLLYARDPISGNLTAPSPGASGNGTPNAHLRWHQLRGEWVAYASHRQNRTFLAPREYNPLAPTTDPTAPTEVPSGGWDASDVGSADAASHNQGCCRLDSLRFDELRFEVEAPN